MAHLLLEHNVICSKHCKNLQGRYGSSILETSIYCFLTQYEKPIKLLTKKLSYTIIAANKSNRPFDGYFALIHSEIVIFSHATQDKRCEKDPHCG